MSLENLVPAKPRGGGRYTESQYFGFIRSGLRQKYSRWAPRYDTLLSARQVSKARRYKWKYRCALCSKVFPQKDIQVDHIIPCGSIKCYADLPGFVERLFCEKENLQVLCNTCHKEKTNQHRELA